jgi:hypothetical protein
MASKGVPKLFSKDIGELQSGPPSGERLVEVEMMERVGAEGEVRRLRELRAANSALSKAN